MTPALLLRIAGLVALLQGAAHGLLVVFATPKHGPREVAVVHAMQTERFDFLGSLRSYWDFYFGYAMAAAGACFVEAALFWLLAGLAGGGAGSLRPIVALFVVANLGHAAVARKYFFITPIVPDLVIALLLGLALVV